MTANYKVTLGTAVQTLPTLEAAKQFVGDNLGASKPNFLPQTKAFKAGQIGEKAVVGIHGKPGVVAVIEIVQAEDASKQPTVAKPKSKGTKKSGTKAKNDEAPKEPEAVPEVVNQEEQKAESAPVPEAAKPELREPITFMMPLAGVDARYIAVKSADGKVWRVARSLSRSEVGLEKKVEGEMYGIQMVKLTVSKRYAQSRPEVFGQIPI